MSPFLVRCLIASSLLPLFTGSALAACDKAEAIIEQAYPQMKGDYDSPERIACRPWPSRPGTTLAAVPFIEANPATDTDPSGDVELLAIDDRTGAIIARYVEKGAANSDALNFDGVALDVARYDLKLSNRAFGLRVTGSKSGTGFGISEETLWLYTLDDNVITPRLSGLVTLISTGQSGDKCEDNNGTELRRTIKVGSAGPQGFNDLIIQQTKEETASSAAGKKCTEKKTKSPRNITLRFGGKTYAPVLGREAEEDNLFLDKSLSAEETTAPAKPSFDCAKASSPQEKAICADHGLAAADLDLSKAFQRLLGEFDATGKAALKADQGIYIAARDARFSKTSSSGDENAARIVMRDGMITRTNDLNMIDPTPAEGFAGEWYSYSGSANVDEKDGAFALSLTTSNPVTGGSMCQFENIAGKVVDGELVVEPDHKGWLVKARRNGPTLEINLVAPASAAGQGPPFCAEGGKIGGVMLARLVVKTPARPAKEADAVSAQIPAGGLAGAYKRKSAKIGNGSIKVETIGAITRLTFDIAGAPKGGATAADCGFIAEGKVDAGVFSGKVTKVNLLEGVNPEGDDPDGDAPVIKTRLQNGEIFNIEVKSGDLCPLGTDFGGTFKQAGKP